jgi:hypothetical protein
MAAGAATPGAPGAMGGARAGNEQKEKKRPNYLQSTENLDAALGAPPLVVKPVVER